MITLNTSLELVDEDMNHPDIYYTVFPIPAVAVTDLLKREKNKYRVIIDVNGKGTMHSGLTSNGKGEYFVSVSRERRKQFGIEVDDEVSLIISPDDSEYGLPLPEELAELWAVDEDAFKLFHGLSPGRQRNLIFIVGKPKGVDTRVKKAVQVSEYLKESGGVLDTRALSAYMKADNVNW